MVNGLLALGLLAGVWTGCQTMTRNAPDRSAELFQTHVRSVLEHRCAHCHHPGKALAGLNVLDRDLVLGPQSFVVPGDPKASRLWVAIDSPETHPRVMPGDGWGLGDRQKQAFKDWIATGAEWPEGPTGALQKKEYTVELEDGL